jgi:hypothetical protein
VERFDWYVPLIFDESDELPYSIFALRLRFVRIDLVKSDAFHIEMRYPLVSIVTRWKLDQIEVDSTISTKGLAN